MNKGFTFSTYQSLEDTFDQFIQNQMETNAQMAKFQEQTNRAMEDIRSQLTQLIQTLSVIDLGQY